MKRLYVVRETGGWMNTFAKKQDVKDYLRDLKTYGGESGTLPKGLIVQTYRFEERVAIKDLMVDV